MASGIVAASIFLIFVIAIYGYFLPKDSLCCIYVKSYEN